MTTLASVAADEVDVARTVAFASLFFFGLGLLVVARHVLRRFGIERAAHVAATNQGAAWKALGLALLTLVVVSIASLSVGPDPGTDAGWDLGRNLVGFGASVALGIALARKRGSEALSSMGFVRGDNPRAVLVGLFVFALALPTILAIGVIWTGFLHSIGRTVEPQTIVTELMGLPPSALLVPLVIGTFLQPFCEEVLFRGMLQPLLVRRLGAAAGIVLTSALFAALHGMSFFLPIFVLSLLLGVLFQVTGRLSASCAAHAANNGLQFLFLLAYPRLQEVVEQGLDHGRLHLF